MVLDLLRHCFGLIAGGALLWILWTRFDGEDQVTRRIVAAGFLLRAFGAQALFWISYLHLPIARSLQAGKGLWFFAIDGAVYLPESARLAENGLLHLGVMDPSWISRFFLQTLAVFIYFLGNVASAGLLLNLVCYLATALVLVAWRANRLPLIVISFAPGCILWSLQPLKESLFTFLAVLFLFCLARFVETHRWPYAICLIVAAYAVSSVRWYFGFILAMTTGVAFAVDVFRAKFLLRRTLAALVLFVVLVNTAGLGAAAQLPEKLRPFATFSPRLLFVRQRARDVAYAIESVRDGFDRTSGSTIIGSSPGEATVAAMRKRTNLYRYAEMIENDMPLPQGMVRSRLLTGVVAMFVPHFVGLLRIGGGRGFWWFADVQTLVFDVAGVLALLALVRAARARRLGNPMLWQLVSVVVLLMFAQAYAVSNFGTLFRHREMVLLTLVLLPFVASAATRGDSDTLRMKDEG